MTVTHTLPRYVIPKPLKSGAVGYYFNVPTIYRKAGCKVPNEPLGTDYVVACGEDGKSGDVQECSHCFFPLPALSGVMFLKRP